MAFADSLSQVAEEGLVGLKSGVVKVARGASKPCPSGRALMGDISSALDLFKGVLCFFMVYSHVDLTVVNPVDQYYTPAGHFVGNVASSMCFLGFVASYGFTCYLAYFSPLRNRPLSEELNRVGRSICLPVVGAWVTNFAWATMFFKLPLTQTTLWPIFTFYNVFGNGPDFILSFSTMLAATYAMKPLLLWALNSGDWQRKLFSCAAMVLLPLTLCYCPVQNCMGSRKYIQFMMPCEWREPWTANLPALPHLFYFFLGFTAAHILEQVCLDERLVAQLSSRMAYISYVLPIPALMMAAVPLFSVYALNYGNLTAHTKYGDVVRGFVGGPSALWLLGNVFSLYILFWVSMAITKVCKAHWTLTSVARLIEHLGANVLIYLVVSDIFLAGIYNGKYGLHVWGGGLLTVCIMSMIRFLHYLGQSSRK